jgi:hypothetical protein
LHWPGIKSGNPAQNFGIYCTKKNLAIPRRGDSGHGVGLDRRQLRDGSVPVHVEQAGRVPLGPLLEPELEKPVDAVQIQEASSRGCKTMIKMLMLRFFISSKHFSILTKIFKKIKRNNIVLNKKRHFFAQN